MYGLGDDKSATVVIDDWRVHCSAAGNRWRKRSGGYSRGLTSDMKGSAWAVNNFNNDLI